MITCRWSKRQSWLSGMREANTPVRHFCQVSMPKFRILTIHLSIYTLFASRSIRWHAFWRRFAQPGTDHCLQACRFLPSSILQKWHKIFPANQGGHRERSKYRGYPVLRTIWGALLGHSSWPWWESASYTIHSNFYLPPLYSRPIIVRFWLAYCQAIVLDIRGEGIIWNPCSCKGL